MSPSNGTNTFAQRVLGQIQIANDNSLQRKKQIKPDSKTIDVWWDNKKEAAAILTLQSAGNIFDEFWMTQVKMNEWSIV